MESFALVVSDFASSLPDDLVWLAEHQGSHYTATTCRTILRTVRPDAADHQKAIAKARHSLGTRLIDLITHGAVEIFGRATVAEFLELDCDIDAEDGYEYIRFAKGTTAEQAETYGFTRCRIAMQVVQVLGLRGIRELAAKPFDVPTDDGSVEKVSLTPKVPVSKLRWALRQLKAAAVEQPAPPEEPSRATKRRMREFGEIVDRHVERSPVLAAVNLRVTLYAREARVQHRPLTTGDQFAAMAEVYTELSKVR